MQYFIILNIYYINISKYTLYHRCFPTVMHNFRWESTFINLNISTTKAFKGLYIDILNFGNFMAIKL